MHTDINDKDLPSSHTCTSKLLGNTDRLDLVRSLDLHDLGSFHRQFSSLLVELGGDVVLINVPSQRKSLVEAGLRHHSLALHPLLPGDVHDAAVHNLDLNVLELDVWNRHGEGDLVVGLVHLVSWLPKLAAESVAAAEFVPRCGRAEAGQHLVSLFVHLLLDIDERLVEHEWRCEKFIREVREADGERWRSDLHLSGAEVRRQGGRRGGGVGWQGPPLRTQRGCEQNDEEDEAKSSHKRRHDVGLIADRGRAGL
jgi:hypothetical protein